MVKQCHKPPIWEWFIPPMYGDFGDGLSLFYIGLPTLLSLWVIIYNPF